MNRKNIAYGIIALIIVVAAGFALTRKKNDTRFDKKTVEVTASDQERNSLQKQTDDLKAQIEIAKKNTDDKQKLFDLYIQLGSNQRTLGLLSDARDSYKAAIDLVPNNVTAWTTIYSAYYDLGDFDDAKVAAQKALALNPSDWNLWRSLIELQTNQFHLTADELKPIYQQALDATSSNINIVTFYAEFLEKTGDLKGAKAQWQNAIKINPAGKKDYQIEVNRLDALIKQK